MGTHSIPPSVGRRSGVRSGVRSGARPAARPAARSSARSGRAGSAAAGHRAAVLPCWLGFATVSVASVVAQFAPADFTATIPLLLLVLAVVVVVAWWGANPVSD